MTSTQQKEESNDSKESREVSKSGTMSLRSRFLLNTKKNKSADAKYNLELLCKLLCKPVSVSLTRLPISELNKSLKTVSDKTGAKSKRRSKPRSLFFTQKKRTFLKVVDKKHPDTEGKIVEQNDTPTAKDAKKNVQPRIRISRKRKISKDHTEEVVSLKTVQQPCVKLQRIDKVINKIAQTFAKVISDKDTKSDKVTQHEQETEIELNALTLQSSPVNNKTECSGNNGTQSSICESCTDDNVLVNQNVDESSDTFEINYTQKRKRRRIIYDSDDNGENTNTKDISNEVVPRETEKLKSDSAEKVVQTSVTDEKHNESGTLEESGIRTTRNEEVTVQIPPQELDVPEESCGLVDQQNSRDESKYVNVTDTLEDVHGKSDPVIERNEKDNASECVPSEIDLIRTSEDACSQLKDNSSVSIEEPTSVPSVCNEIQDQMQESFFLKENLESRYELFKDLRVLLIKLDSIKTLLDTEYSATEIEQLTNKYINVVLNTKPLHTTPQVLPSNSVYLEKSVAQSKLHPCVESSNICEDDSTTSIVKYVQNTDGACSNIYKSPRLTSKVQEQQDDTSTNQNNSPKREENVSCHDSKSVLAPGTTLSSPKKSIIKNFKFSSRIKHNENRQKSARALKRNSMVKSCSELQNSTSREKPLRKLSHSENSEEASTNLESTEATNVKKFRKMLPKIIVNTLVSKNNIKGENVSNNNEKILIGGKKVRVVKLHLKPVNASDVKITGNKSSTESTSSMPFPVKHNAYKCIVCDLRFENYSLLQQHLPMHRQKQHTVSASHTVPSEEIPTGEEHKETASAKSGAEGSSESNESQEATSESAAAKKSKALSQKKQRRKEKESEDSSLNKDKSSFARRRVKLPPEVMNNTIECNICTQVFPTNADLAAHIFLHSESELQRACKNTMQKRTKTSKEKKTGEKTEEDTTKESATEIAENVSESEIDTVEKASDTVNETEVKCSKSLSVSEEDKSLTAPGLEVPVEKKINDTFDATKSTASNESVSNEVQTPPMQNGAEKSRTSKASHNKRGFVICQCHNRSEVSDNSLQIEIVLLCHTCRVLFRSIECFETHYRLPDFTLCSQNRVKSGRSPNLFCATCGMVFSSVQDVRHHLEIHARFKQNFTTDFRCNICKVVFIGIGSLFYIHWSKHAKDTFWVASEQSFPKSSLIKSRSANVNIPVDGDTPSPVKSAGTYIHVAEHTCCNCNVPFVTADDLKKHESSCKVPKSTEDTAAPEIPVEKTRKDSVVNFNLTKDAAVSATVQKIRKKYKVEYVSGADKAVEKIQKSPTIRVTCTLCYGIFSEKLEFFRHMRSKHNFISEPEFVCVSLTAIKRAFICTVCMEISEDILQFEEHWLKHSTNQPCFVCLICNEGCDNLKSVAEHMKAHECTVKKGIFPCKVVYQAAKFICTLCNIGFESQKNLTEHSIVHKVNFLTLQQKNKKTPDQGCSTSVSGISNPPNLMKLKELVVAREKAISAEKQTDTVNNQTVERTEDSMKLKKDVERERLINILEGKDDSENELTIDLTESSKECRGLQREGGNTDKSLTTASTSVADPDLVIISESLKEISDTNLSSSNNSQASLPESKEEPARPKKNSPVKPKPGFLRVRNIAELMDNTKIRSREESGGTPENTESPRQNASTRTALNQKSTSPLQQTKRRIVVSKTTPPPLVLSKRPTNTNRQATQSSTILTSNQSSQSHSNIIQGRDTSIQDSTAAYHRNLPACNIIQKSVAVPRSSILRSVRVPVKATASSFDAQNIQVTPVTTYTIAEHPQASSRSSVTSSPIVTLSASSSQLNPSYQVHSIDSGDGYMVNPNTQSASNEQNRESIAQTGRNVVDNTAAETKSNAMSNNSNYKQPQTNCASSTSFYQYLTTGVKNLSSDNRRSVQSQQMISNQPVARTAPLYYKSTTGGGMSIVINQTTPAVQSMPAIGILPNQGQHVYQPLVCGNPVAHMNPYMQQPQNMNNFAGLNNMYSMAPNQYEVPAAETLTTYEVMLQAAEGLVCSYCPNAVPFMSDELLQLHIDSAHNYECDICNQRLYNFSDLTLHRTKHRFMKRRI